FWAILYRIQRTEGKFLKPSKTIASIFYLIHSSFPTALKSINPSKTYAWIEAGGAYHHIPALSFCYAQKILDFILNVKINATFPFKFMSQSI
ncbi:hypothetical protein, partial [Staphylococcus pseudintermedius]|uniref:hypothetical protein n=2 Tax=Staphylococcus pseudintermedius TaxID=283734 RepID=UPI001C6F5C27